MDEDAGLRRITTRQDILGGKPTIRGHRLAVEHILGMLAAGDSQTSRDTTGLSGRIFRHASCTRGASWQTNG